MKVATKQSPTRTKRFGMPVVVVLAVASSTELSLCPSPACGRGVRGEGSAPSLQHRDALDLDARTGCEPAGAKRAARGTAAGGEELHVDLVHRAPFLYVRKEHGAFHDPVHRRAVPLDRGLYVRQRGLGLWADAAFDEAAAIGLHADRAG